MAENGWEAKPFAYLDGYVLHYSGVTGALITG